jgi:hypothetical protein
MTIAVGTWKKLLELLRLLLPATTIATPSPVKVFSRRTTSSAFRSDMPVLAPGRSNWLFQTNV